jgi:CheY-like chemotaxis protein
MLAFSGHTTFELKRFDLSTLVAEMTQLLRASIPPNATTDYACATGLPEIEGDPTQVRQVIMNLIVNASEAVEAEGGGHVHVSTGVCHVEPGTGSYGLDVPQAGDFVFLRVEDDGIGMPEEVLERIYDPFFSTKFAGRGLGLATMLGIMRSCQGGISIESKVGTGSCFSVFFPVASKVGVAANTLTTEAAPDSMSSTTPLHSGKALLVDDDQTVLLLGTEMLSRLGFEVLPASDGEEAISLFKQHHQALSLVVLDLTMPHMDGEETLRHLQAIDRSIPVIMSSGYTEQDVARRVGENDFAAFMQKPYTLSQLTGVLATVLR